MELWRGGRVGQRAVAPQHHGPQAGSAPRSVSPRFQSPYAAASLWDAGQRLEVVSRGSQSRRPRVRSPRDAYAARRHQREEVLPLQLEVLDVAVIHIAEAPMTIGAGTPARITSARPWGARASRSDRGDRAELGLQRLHPRPEKARLMTRRERRCAGGSVLVIKGTGGTPVLKTTSASGHKGAMLWIESFDEEKRFGLLQDGTHIVVAGDDPHPEHVAEEDQAPPGARSHRTHKDSKLRTENGW